MEARRPRVCRRLEFQEAARRWIACRWIRERRPAYRALRVMLRGAGPRRDQLECCQEERRRVRGRPESRVGQGLRRGFRVSDFAYRTEGRANPCGTLLWGWAK